jgi:peptide chain release factor subunit 1
VVSLYLDARPDQHGLDNFGPFVEKEFVQRARIFRRHSPAWESFNRDSQRILSYLRQEVREAANGIVIFACDGNGQLFEALQLEAAIEENRLYVAQTPQLYPLARLLSRHPRYAVVVADTNQGRVFVVALDRVVNSLEVTGRKTNRTEMGGWSQARYQRHIENYHLHHVKELVDVLDRVVRAEQIEHVILAGDQVVLPLIREQLPKPLALKVIDHLAIPMAASQAEVVAAATAAVRGHRAASDAQKVERLLDAYGADGLGVVGQEETAKALANGQVDELLISEETGRPTEEPPGEVSADGADPVAVSVADELVREARRTGASVTVIEDPSLLADVGGVGAFLRYRI